MNDDKSASASEKPPRHIYIWFLATFGGLMSLVTCWLLWQGLPGKPIVVSRTTTYITEPLRRDGLPDYEAFLLDKYRAGVTPDNNAGVLLYQAIWPGELEPADYQHVCDELGLGEVPSAEDALQDPQSEEVRAAIKAWLTDRGVVMDQILVDDSYLDEVLFATTVAAWTSQNLPPFAEWLNSNQKPLDLVVAASLRSHYYIPSPSLLNDKHEMLIEMLLPGVQGVRTVTRALSIRAMNHLGEGRLDDAWNDTLALHRLANLASQSHTIVEKLVAIAMHGIANDATMAILSDDNLPLDLARRIHADLSTLDRRVSLRETLGTVERISTLDSVIYSSKYGLEQLGDQPDSPAADTSSYKVDWNVVLNDVNYWYDRLEQAIAHGDYAERQQAIEKYESDLDESGRAVKHPFTLVKAYFSRKARSKTIGSIFSNLMLPAVSAAIAAEERNEAMLQLTDIAAALAVYRAEHGGYPNALAELTPELLPMVPIDPTWSRELVYKRDGDGYLLYSLGPNGIDDSGSNEMQSLLAGVKLDEVKTDKRPNHLDQIHTGADDISIRLPRPPFKLPEPPDSP